MYAYIYAMYKWSEWQQWYNGWEAGILIILLLQGTHSAPWSGIVLFESGLGLIANVYCKLWGNH